MPAETTSEAAPTTAHHPWARTLLSAAPFVALGVLAVAYLRTLGGPSLWLDEAWEANYYVGVEPSPWYNRPVLYMASVRALVVLGRTRRCSDSSRAWRGSAPSPSPSPSCGARWASPPRGSLRRCWPWRPRSSSTPTSSRATRSTRCSGLGARLVPLARPARGGTSPPSPRSRCRSASRSTGAFVVAACAAGEVWSTGAPFVRLVPFVVVCAALAALFAAVFLVWHAGATGDDLLQAYFVERYPRLAGGLGALGSPLVVGVVRDQTGIVSGVAAITLAGAGLSGWPGAGAQGP